MENGDLFFSQETEDMMTRVQASNSTRMIDIIKLTDLDPKIDFAGADLSGVDLRGIDFSGANLVATNFENANLTKVNLAGADLTNSNFKNAKLKFADLSGSNLTNANLDHIDGLCANFIGANFSGTSLDSANIKFSSLSDSNFYLSEYRNALAGGVITTIQTGRNSKNAFLSRYGEYIIDAISEVQLMRPMTPHIEPHIEPLIDQALMSFGNSIHELPRVTFIKSSAFICIIAIDDAQGKILSLVSSEDEHLHKRKHHSVSIERSAGAVMGKTLISMNIKEAVLDVGDYKIAGRIKEMLHGLRSTKLDLKSEW